MTLGASTIAAAATAASAPPVFTRNLRRSVVTLISSLELRSAMRDIGKRSGSDFLACRNWAEETGADGRRARVPSLAVSGPLMLHRLNGTSPERPIVTCTTADQGRT